MYSWDVDPENRFIEIPWTRESQAAKKTVYILWISAEVKMVGCVVHKISDIGACVKVDCVAQHHQHRAPRRRFCRSVLALKRIDAKMFVNELLASFFCDVGFYDGVGACGCRCHCHHFVGVRSVDTIGAVNPTKNRILWQRAAISARASPSNAPKPYNQNNKLNKDNHFSALLPQYGWA